jgi:hypothetical protein
MIGATSVLRVRLLLNSYYFGEIEGVEFLVASERANLASRSLALSD